ncbi:GNAT family N-acetyltransferase [Vagococcus silagei]|uniref:N-acetyltransferase n=1 Tax=Vagococcus silagei TaxID=2508885 RepID=A0A4S3B441_9ENTE|nr:GNAT family N-acetyltransferase [Vagococcus silagei]THB61572.1 N-acetyltransferase [Vagococcus silagei]
MSTESMNLILAKNQRIDTKRCLLRKITLEDTDDMFEYCQNPNVSKYTTFYPHQSKRDTQEVIANIFLSNQLTNWGIELKDCGKIIGTISIVPRSKNEFEFAWAIGESYWGKGIVYEAAEQLLQLVFELLETQIVCARFLKQNVNSGRVMEKLGMTYWGKDYIQDIKDEKMVEILKYGLTREEYQKNNIL